MRIHVQYRRRPPEPSVGFPGRVQKLRIPICIRATAFRMAQQSRVVVRKVALFLTGGGSNDPVVSLARGSGPHQICLAALPASETTSDLESILGPGIQPESASRAGSARGSGIQFHALDESVGNQ